MQIDGIRTKRASEMNSAASVDKICADKRKHGIAIRGTGNINKLGN
jgi:hypothetical protein